MPHLTSSISYFQPTSPLGARSCPGSRCRDSGRLGLFRGRQAGVFSKLYNVNSCVNFLSENNELTVSFNFLCSTLEFFVVKIKLE